MGYGYGNGNGSNGSSNVVRLRFHLVFDWIFNYSLLLVAIYLPADTAHLPCPALLCLLLPCLGIRNQYCALRGTHVRTACPGRLSRKWQRIDCVPSAAAAATAFAFPTHQIPIASLNGIFNAKPQTSKLCWSPPHRPLHFFSLCGCVGHLHSSCLKRAYLQIFELDLGSCKLWRGISG